ncbi:DUF1707 SHOCT-like domain-containing protein [Actinomadura miaoliensis]|uniref:DUF1707 domain-containing protein n=1 Tax=Actinomadura miaoliensis TaxID=430685 RepID=A0ABP7V8D0_9ACTN
MPDAARDAVVARLNRACGQGLLSLRDYSARVEEIHFARTRDDLERLVRDLPEGDAVAESDAAAEGGTEWHVAPVGGLRRHGRWHMDRHLVSLSVVGGTCLDLRDAQLTAPEVTLTKVSLLGGVTVCVPHGVRVVLEGGSLLRAAGLFGGRADDDCEPLPPDAPTLRIRAFSLFGGVTVQAPHPVSQTAVVRGIPEDRA